MMEKFEISQTQSLPSLTDIQKNLDNLYVELGEDHAKKLTLAARTTEPRPSSGDSSDSDSIQPKHQMHKMFQKQWKLTSSQFKKLRKRMGTRR